jgi:hypothetical protein
MTTIYRLRFVELPQLGGPGPRSYIPRKQGGPAIRIPRHRVSFRRLLRLAWPHGI